VAGAIGRAIVGLRLDDGAHGQRTGDVAADEQAAQEVAGEPRRRTVEEGPRQRRTGRRGEVPGRG